MLREVVSTSNATRQETPDSCAAADAGAIVTAAPECMRAGRASGQRGGEVRLVPTACLRPAAPALHRGRADSIRSSQEEVNDIPRASPAAAVHAVGLALHRLEGGGLGGDQAHLAPEYGRYPQTCTRRHPRQGRNCGIIEQHTMLNGQYSAQL